MKEGPDKSRIHLCKCFINYHTRMHAHTKIQKLMLIENHRWLTLNTWTEKKIVSEELFNLRRVPRYFSNFRKFRWSILFRLMADTSFRFDESRVRRLRCKTDIVKQALVSGTTRPNSCRETSENRWNRLINRWSDFIRDSVELGSLRSAA